jgi:hypothetical protein
MLGRGCLTVIRVPAHLYDRSRWLERLRWTLRTDRRLISAAFGDLSSCDTVVFTGSPPFLLHFLVPLNLLLRKRLIYRITDFYPECLIAALGRAPLPLRLLHSWTCFLRRWVDEFQVLGHDQERRLREIAIPADRIILKRDPSPVTITGDEEPLTTPAEIAGHLVLLYSGNFGIAHDVDTFLEGYRAHHRRGSGRVALWLNAIGASADRLEVACRAEALAVARTPPVPLDLLPHLLVTPAAHLITLRPEFTGFVLPSKVHGCLASGRSILYVGDPASDVHALCERATADIPVYRQVNVGDPEGVEEALEVIADCAEAEAAGEECKRGPPRSHAHSPMNAVTVA